MQTALLPRSVCDELDRKCRGFLWGSNQEKKKIHLVKWEGVTKPKCCGGLGIRSARQANAAFLTKLGWRVINEPSSLWSRALRNKYCSGRNNVDMLSPSPNASRVERGFTWSPNFEKRNSNDYRGRLSYPLLASQLG